MPPRRSSPSPSSGRNSNPLDLVFQLIGVLFGNSQAGKQKAAFTTFLLMMLVVVGTFGWYLFQPHSRKVEIQHTVGNYSQTHKQIKVSEIIWDLWTRYIRRPYVPTQVQGGQNIIFGGEPQRGAFPYEVSTLYNTAYTVGYCEALDNPVWSAYRIFDLEKEVRPPKRPENFFMDPRTRDRVEPGDYTGSGYDRGHMTPNYAIATRFGMEAQEETFKMSNICPQRHRLNAGLWKDLEQKIANNYTGRFGQVWVVSGPIFGPLDRLPRIRNKIPIPEAFFMIITEQHEGGVRAEAFIMDQDTPASGSLDPYLTTIAEIERRTGLNFYPKMEKQAQTALENTKNSSVW